MSNELVPIAAAQAVPILTEAFAKDPVFVYFTGTAASAAQAPKRLQIMNTIAQLHALSGQSVWGWRVDGQIMGCALVEDRPNPLRQAVAVLRALPTFLRLPLTVLLRLNAYSARSRRGQPEGVSHFLALLGLSDQARGKGQGRRFLEALHAQYGPAAHWALDTENPANLPFYERLGYRLYAQETLGPVTMFKLHRPPQTGIPDENQP